MSRELILALRREAAFDPTPLPQDLAALHVPFDRLLGEPRVERALAEAARAADRIAVVGSMGGGKSSVLAHTLTHGNGFAALPISVAPEHDETVTEPGAFAQHAVRVVSTWAAEVEMLSEEDRDKLLRAVSDTQALASRSRQTHAAFTVQLPWLVKGELARDIRRELETGAELRRSAAEHLEALKRLTRLIRAVELEPVLVVDDSDRWLRHGEPRRDLVAGFFGRVVRELAELQIGFAVAVHEHYLELDEYRETTPGVLSARVDVPKLTEPEQLAAIIAHRIRAFGESGELLDEGALARLWEFYEGDGGHSLRVTLQMVHTAVAEAALAEYGYVAAGLIEAAIAAWMPS